MCFSVTLEIGDETFDLMDLMDRRKHSSAMTLTNSRYETEGRRVPLCLA